MLMGRRLKRGGAKAAKGDGEGWMWDPSKVGSDGLGRTLTAPLGGMPMESQRAGPLGRP
jgi:hypothetical protein